MAFTTQPLSVAVQYSAAQEVAEALGLSVAVRVGHEMSLGRGGGARRAGRDGRVGASVGSTGQVGAARGSGWLVEDVAH
eukprot:scaffold4575_cov55-Phaeocystis_antarctica.AAC.2